MKAIIYITISLATTMNACQQNDQSKSTTIQTTNTNSDNTPTDTLDINAVTLNTNSSDSLQKLDNKTNADLEPTDDYFKLLSATSENWTAGIPNGGSGTEYYFKIKITTAEKIVFDTVWTNNKAFTIFISKENNSVSSEPIKYSNTDIITLRVSDLKKSTNVKPPINYKAAALIGYNVNGVRKYSTIQEITKQNSTNRP